MGSDARALLGLDNCYKLVTAPLELIFVIVMMWLRLDKQPLPTFASLAPAAAMALVMVRAPETLSERRSSCFCCGGRLATVGSPWGHCTAVRAAVDPAICRLVSSTYALCTRLPACQPHHTSPLPASSSCPSPQVWLSSIFGRCFKRARVQRAARLDAVRDGIVNYLPAKLYAAEGRVVAAAMVERKKEERSLRKAFAAFSFISAQQLYLAPLVTTVAGERG